MESQKVPEKPKSKVVETYAADMVKSIDGSEGIYIKKIIDEQERAELEKQNLSPESRRNRLFMYLGVALFILGVGIIGVFFTYQREIFSVDVPVTFSPIIYLDSTKFTAIDDLNREQVSQTIFNETVMTKVKQGGIEGVYLTQNKKIIGLKQFLNIVAPDVDVTRLKFVSDNFLIGVDNQENKNIFFLIKTRSFVDIFDSMRTWENNMFNDLHTIFGVDLNADTKYLLVKDFEDGIVQNHNARILRDSDGKMILMYVFIDDTTVLFTNNLETAHEISLRLSAGTIRK